MQSNKMHLNNKPNPNNKVDISRKMEIEDHQKQTIFPKK